MRPGWQRGLIWNHWGSTNKMDRSRQIPTWKFETGDRELQIGVWKSYDGVEQIRRQGANAQASQAGVQMALDGIIDDSAVLVGDGGILRAPSLVDRRW